VFSTKVDKKLCNIYAKIEKNDYFFKIIQFWHGERFTHSKKSNNATEFIFVELKLSFSIFSQMFFIRRAKLDLIYSGSLITCLKH